MKYKDYFKDNIIGIIIYLSTVLLLFLMLNAFKIDITVNVLTTIILLISGISIISINYYRKNKFYKSYLNSLNKLF